MAGADRAAQHLQGAALGRSELKMRIASAAVLAPLALAAAYFGSLAIVLVCAAVAIGIWWEWAALSADRAPRVVAVGAGVLAAATLLVANGWIGVGVACLAAGALAVAACADGRGWARAWIAAGVPYAGVMLVAPVVLRGDPGYGFFAICFLFAVVWSTDVAAYFAGRAIGGAKLAPRLSPNKTWAGALAGAGGAVIAAVSLAAATGLGRLPAIATVALGLSIASQAGDLFESAFKRWYGAKDAGRLIPGHGGLMDRLDGFIAAALAAVVVGLVRGGPEAPARGLFLW